MPVPFIDLSRLVKEIKEDVLADWAGCLDRCEFVGGSRVVEMEKKLAAALGVPRAISCANGTDALLVALEVLGVKAGSKVALPNLTFWATYEAIARLGATPVLVDVDPDDLQMSLAELKKAHEAHRVDAAIFVHLFGWTSAQLTEIRAFCKERNIGLLEDGAQAYGAEVSGAAVLSKSQISTLSFYPAKVVGGAMDGGAITFQSEKDEVFARSLCNHGRSSHYSYAHVGWNSRMGGTQGAFLCRVLDRGPAIIENRRKAAAKYRELLKPLVASGKIRHYGPPSGVVENGYLVVVTAAGKKGTELEASLKAAGIGCARTYPETMADQPPATGAIRVGDLKVSRAFCESVVNLPIFYGIREDEIETSVKAFANAVGT